MNLLETALAVGCLGGAFWLWRGRDDRKGSSARTRNNKVTTQTAHIARPAGHLPILDAQGVIERTRASGLIEQIRTNVGFTPENWAKDVEPLLYQFCEFVQLLPASESHHHAQPGGLVLHTLEVASHALKIRAGCKLPPGGAPEEQIGQSAVWTYSVLVGALLHDIGKPVADVTVHLYGANAQEVCIWPGLAGPMNRVQGASFYSVQFDTVKDYAQHSKLPVMLLHAMVPASSLQWLGQHPGVLSALVEYLQGEPASEGQTNPLKQIISQADSVSVAENLRIGSRIRFANTRAAPLIERLHRGMSNLLVSGHLSFNRPGAACFIDAQDLWCVAGTIADQVRRHLDETERRLTGAAKLPLDNTRLFDTWAEYGAVTTAPAEFGKGAVWWVRIEIEGWSQVLTVLRFPLRHFAGIALPSPMVGTITPVSPSTSRVSTEASPSGSAAVATDTETETERTTAVVDEAADISGESTHQESENLSEPPLHSKLGQAEVPEVPEFLNEYLDDAETAKAAIALPPAEVPSGKSSKSLKIRAGNQVQAMPRNSGNEMYLPAVSIGRAPRALLQRPGSKPRPNAERFMLWLQQSLGTGELSYNESDAPVHFVGDGMIILSPKIFKLYLQNHEYEGDVGGAKDALRALQGDIQRSGYIKRNGKGSFHFYRVVSSDGTATGHKITTYLVPNPQAYIRPVPSPNPLLQPYSPDEPAAGTTD